MAFDVELKKELVVICAVCFFAFIAIVLRIYPLLVFSGADIVDMVGSDDPIYNLRLIELIIQNYPNYPWFDAFTLHPTGQTIPWGPLFPMIVATACILLGATTQAEIITIAIAIPPLLAAATVVVVYLGARKIWSMKEAAVASFFTAIITGQFFFRSMAGYVDHHVLEVLLSTLFCFLYIIAIKDTRDKISRRGFRDLKLNDVLSILLFPTFAGVAYVIGYANMPTMVLFALLAMVFTAILIFLEFRWKANDELLQSQYLCWVNAIVFGIAIIGTILIGFHADWRGLYFYSIIHPIAYFGIIVATCTLCALSYVCYNRTPIKLYDYNIGAFAQFVAIVCVGGVSTILLLKIVDTSLYEALVNGVYVFLGINPFSTTIQEARPWMLQDAMIYGAGFALAIGGFLIIAWDVVKNRRVDRLFIFVWSAFTLISAWQQVRYEYYFAINLAMLSAVFFVAVVWRTFPGIEPLFRRVDGNQAKINYVHAIAAITVILLAVMFSYSSFMMNYRVSTSSEASMNNDWKEATLWLGNNTPDVGIDYAAIYSKDSFKYPESAYGVTSWWDYGHLITYFAHRIPTANPFQNGVSGKYGASTFLMNRSETNANEIASVVGTKYVITDIEMTTGKYWAMATWHDPINNIDLHQKRLYVPAQRDVNTGGIQYEPVMFNLPLYYQSLVVRLHHFDGSMVIPNTTLYVEYAPDDRVGGNFMLLKGEELPYQEALEKTVKFNENPSRGLARADLMSYVPTVPVVGIPALKTYRLIHESPRYVFPQNYPNNVKYVKVFEHVKGAVINGEGIIYISLATKEGRIFQYAQESEQGEFRVPYSTEPAYDIIPLSKYKILGSEMEIEVSNDAVINGLVIVD